MKRFKAMDRFKTDSALRSLGAGSGRASARDSRPGPSAEDIARVLGALADEHAAEREPEVRRRVWARLTGQPRLVQPKSSALPLTLRSSLRGWLLGFGFASSLASAALWFALTPSQLEYRVNGEVSESGSINTGYKAALVEFSDSSWLKVEENSALEVTVVGEHSALTRLWSGQVHANVHHEESTNWRFLAGPYEVHVIGTEFDLDWDPESTELGLQMVEGKVRVVGPNGASRVLTGGQSLKWGGKPKEAAPLRSDASVVSAGNQPEASTANAVSQTTSSRDKATEISSSEARNHEAARNHEVPALGTAPNQQSWNALLARGKFQEVVDEARQQGMKAALASRSASELKALAQAARYVGDGGLAERVWSKVRSRFAGRPIAAQAAFFLGRIEERSGNSSAAIRSFEAYLKQAPRGVYASEALGRKLVLLNRSGGATRARPVAEGYLRRYPEGPYADLARQIAKSP